MEKVDGKVTVSKVESASSKQEYTIEGADKKVKIMADDKEKTPPRPIVLNPTAIETKSKELIKL